MKGGENVGYSANAIMAKSRALYGKRLTEANYNDLVNCKSIGELVSYLKAKTAYAAEFESANADITPFQVEELLKMHILSSFEKISRYEASAGVEFYKYFIMKNDIQQLLRYLNYLIIGKPGDYLSVLPPFFNKRSELDLYKLAAARSFDEMLEAIKGTPYFKALEPFKQIYSLPESYLKMECALDRELWETEKNIVSKFSGRSKEKIIEIISYENDMENLVRIYRLKRLADADKDTIKDYLNLNFTHFTQKNIEDMLEKPTARKMLEEATGSYYKKCFKNPEFTLLEDYTHRVLYDKFKKEIRYSTQPVAVMICYFYLAQNEVNNIIRIVEGIRYSMAPEAIIGALIGAQD